MRRELIEAYAARAVEHNRAEQALRLAAEALDNASFEAVHDDGGDVSLPAAVTVLGRVVMVTMVREDANDYLEYTIAESL